MFDLNALSLEWGQTSSRKLPVHVNSIIIVKMKASEGRKQDTGPQQDIPRSRGSWPTYDGGVVVSRRLPVGQGIENGWGVTGVDPSPATSWLICHVQAHYRHPCYILLLTWVVYNMCCSHLTKKQAVVYAIGIHELWTSRTEKNVISNEGCNSKPWQ